MTDKIPSCPIPTCQGENLTCRVINRDGGHFAKKYECISCGYKWKEEFTRREQEEFNG